MRQFGVSDYFDAMYEYDSLIYCGFLRPRHALRSPYLTNRRYVYLCDIVFLTLQRSFFPRFSGRPAQEP